MTKSNFQRSGFNIRNSGQNILGTSEEVSTNDALLQREVESAEDLKQKSVDHGLLQFGQHYCGKSNISTKMEVSQTGQGAVNTLAVDVFRTEKLPVAIDSRGTVDSFQFSVNKVSDDISTNTILRGTEYPHCSSAHKPSPADVQFQREPSRYVNVNTVWSSIFRSTTYF